MTILDYLFQNLFNVNNISSDNETRVVEPSSALRRDSEEEPLMLPILLQFSLQLGLLALCNALKQEKMRRRIITEPEVGFIENFQKEHPHLSRIVESHLKKRKVTDNGKVFITSLPHSQSELRSAKAWSRAGIK